MMFFFGLFVGGFIGLFAVSALTVGKVSDLIDENDRLKYKLYGRDKK